VPRKKKNQPQISFVIVRVQLMGNFVTWAIILGNQATAMTPPKKSHAVYFKCRTDRGMKQVKHNRS
jgi:hypothetical protein